MGLCGYFGFLDSTAGNILRNFSFRSVAANGAGRKRRRRTYSDPNGGRRNADRGKATTATTTTTNAMTLAPNRRESEDDDDDDDDDDYEDMSDVDDGEIVKHIFRHSSVIRSEISHAILQQEVILFAISISVKQCSF